MSNRAGKEEKYAVDIACSSLAPESDERERRKRVIFRAVENIQKKRRGGGETHMDIKARSSSI